MSRILLADDDAGFRDSLQTLLVDAGHSVRAVGIGLEAISAALKELPDARAVRMVRVFRTGHGMIM
ncbi:hypothetical protein [Paraburkholderia tropica]|uniref:hypothetical protein n=1 Tax=Paraburkholderia tropica TaxID=92647 RepID=UPI001F2765CF|nr:hypothetical protein [Paraburkholderia tropica]